ncbi:MAG: hypothetical protein QM773_15355 [Hyphomonadaceae bacterium]
MRKRASWKTTAPATTAATMPAPVMRAILRIFGSFSIASMKGLAAP